MPTIVGASPWFTYRPSSAENRSATVTGPTAAVGDVALLFVLRTYSEYGRSMAPGYTYGGDDSIYWTLNGTADGLPGAEWTLLRRQTHSWLGAGSGTPVYGGSQIEYWESYGDMSVYQRRVSSAGVVTAPMLWPSGNLPFAPYERQRACIVVVSDSSGVGQVSPRPDVQTNHAALVCRFAMFRESNAVDEPTLTNVVPFDKYVGNYPYWSGGAWFGVSQAGRVSASPHAPGEALDSQYFCLELLPQLDPYAPLHVSPAGEVGEGAVEFRARHRPAMPGGRAQAVRMSWTTGGTELWWTGSAWSASVSTISVAPTDDLVVTAQLTAGVSGTVRWWTQSAEDGRWSPGSEPVAVSVVARPTVSGVTFTTTHGDLSPVVQWVAPVEATAFVVRILDVDGGVVWDSGRMVGPDRVLSVPEQPWVNGNQYRAQVTVSTASGVQSLPAQSSLAVVSWTPPAPPSIGVSGSVSAECSCGARHALTVVTAGTGVVVERWESGRWLPLGTSDGQITDWTARGQVEYRARSIVSQWVMSDWAYSGPVQSTARCGVMVVDGQLLPLRISKEGTRAHPIPTLVRHGTGARWATVSEAAGRGREGSLIAHVQSEADAAVIVAALQGRTAVLRMPSDSAVMPGALLWVRRVGEVPMDRIVQAPHEWRTLALSWVEQAPPGGDVAPVPAWIEVGP